MSPRSFHSWWRSCRLTMIVESELMRRNQMTMPGFTAHNSLCRSSQHYISGFFSSWSPPGTVVPSVKPYDPDDGGDCHVTCGQCSHNCMTTCQNSCYPDDAPYSQPCCDSTETCCSGKCIN